MRQPVGRVECQPAQPRHGFTAAGHMRRAEDCVVQFEARRHEIKRIFGKPLVRTKRDHPPGARFLGKIDRRQSRLQRRWIIGSASADD